MRTAEEQLRRMHMRAAEIKREEDRSRLRALGSLSGVLLVCLVVALQQLQCLQHVILTGQSTGSSLLDESAGGYVLAAVIAFALGVTVTLLCIRRRLSTTHKFDERPPRKGDGA